MASYNIFLDKILIIIVLYKVNLKNSSTYNSLKKSVPVPSFFIFDNSPTPMVLNHEVDNKDIIYQHDPTNPGISKAYNDGALIAQKLNKNWLLLADQDTVFPDNYFSILKDQIDLNQNYHLFAPVLKANNIILSPCNFRLGKGFPIKKFQYGVNSLRGKSILNSGIFIDLKSFINLGGYEEQIKLDFSDHAFIRKYYKKYNNFVLLPTIITHSFSSFNDNKVQSKIRFKQYCQGAKSFAPASFYKIIMFVWALLRAIKLSVIFRDLSFLYILRFFNHQS